MGAANTCCASPMNQNPELQKLVIDHERNLALLKLQLEEEKLSHEATERKIHSLKKLQQNTYGSLTEEIQINENLEEQLKEIQEAANDLIQSKLDSDNEVVVLKVKLNKLQSLQSFEMETSNDIKSSDTGVNYFFDAEKDEESGSANTDSAKSDTFSKMQLFRNKMQNILRNEFSAENDAKQVHTWLFSNISSKDEKQRLKVWLTELFTARVYSHRKLIADEYERMYENEMIEDIRKMLKKGLALEIIAGMLLTSVEFDAECLNRAMSANDLNVIISIIATKSMQQLKEIQQEYKYRNQIDIDTEILAFCKKENKNTMSAIVQELFSFVCDDKAMVNMDNVQKDINFLKSNKKFKNKLKEKFCFIFVDNNTTYLKVLNAQWKSMKNNHSGLDVFIDQKIGSKSSAGKYCKIRVLFSVDSEEYFASIFRDLCSNYRKNQQLLASIMISKYENGLHGIQRRFNEMEYGGERNLDKYIQYKSGPSKSAFFLCQMLLLISKPLTLSKKKVKKKTKILSKKE